MELHAQIACAMPRELAAKGIGWQDRAVYTEAIYYGRENLTDGVIARASLKFWMPDMGVAEKTRRLDALRAARALEHHDEGWQFPEHVWRKWGKTRAEVEQKRAEEAQRVREYRERRRQQHNPVDQAEQPDVRDVYARTEMYDREPYATPEPKPKPYPEPKPYPKPEPEPDDDDTRQTQDHPSSSSSNRYARRVAEHYANLIMKRPENHGRDNRYRAGIVRECLAEHDTAIYHAYGNNEPPHTVAERLANPAPPADLERRPRNIPHPPTCECEGTGIIYFEEDGREVAAPCRVTHLHQETA